jgi:flagellar motility protein MotE (MotC chaperone)
MAGKGSQMTRDEASKLYQSLHTQNQEKSGTPESRAAAAGGTRSRIRMAEVSKVRGMGFSYPLHNIFNRLTGHSAAVTMVVFFAAFKIALSALDYFGFASVQVADAALRTPMNTAQAVTGMRAPSIPGQYTREEVEILTQLDKRRVELEERAKRLDAREAEFKMVEVNVATQMNELRELTERLRTNRDQDERKHDAQLDQLSKVYSAMAPEEASKLLEQLDISIALALVKKMPEKRIGQILALLNPERALTLTKMLSGPMR